MLTTRKCPQCHSTYEYTKKEDSCPNSWCQSQPGSPTRTDGGIFSPARVETKVVKRDIISLPTLQPFKSSGQGSPRADLQISMQAPKICPLFLHVDFDNGNDEQARLQIPYFPFKTIESAFRRSKSGTKILIGKGTNKSLSFTNKIPSGYIITLIGMGNETIIPTIKCNFSGQVYLENLRINALMICNSGKINLHIRNVELENLSLEETSTVHTDASTIGMVETRNVAPATIIAFGSKFNRFIINGRLRLELRLSTIDYDQVMGITSNLELVQHGSHLALIRGSQAKIPYGVDEICLVEMDRLVLPPPPSFISRIRLYNLETNMIDLVWEKEIIAKIPPRSEILIFSHDFRWVPFR